MNDLSLSKPVLDFKANLECTFENIAQINNRFQEINEVIQTISNKNFNKTEFSECPDFEILFLDLEQIIQKIHIYVQLKLLSSGDFFQKMTDIKPFLNQFSKHDLIIDESKKQLDETIKNLREKTSTSSLFDTDKNLLLDTLDTTQKIALSVIESSKKIPSLIQRWVELANPPNLMNPKVVQIATLGLIPFNPLWGTITALTYTAFWPKIHEISAKCKNLLLGWMNPDSLGPVISDVKNQFISCQFLSLSTGNKSYLWLRSKTEGAIKFKLNEKDEFFLKFNLNDSPMINKENTDILFEVLSLFLKDGSLKPQDKEKIFEELYALKIQGRTKLVHGQELFANTKFDELKDLP